VNVDRVEEMPSTVQEQTANVVDGTVNAPRSKIAVLGGYIEGLSGLIGGALSSSGGGYPSWMNWVSFGLNAVGGLLGAGSNWGSSAAVAQPTGGTGPTMPQTTAPAPVTPAPAPTSPTPGTWVQRGGVIGDPTLPRVPVGHVLRPGEVPAILHKGELVTPLDSGRLPVRVFPGGKASVTTPGGTVVPVDLDLSKLQAFAAGGVVGAGQLSMLSGHDRHATPQEPGSSRSRESEKPAPVIFQQGAIQITAQKGERMDETLAQVATRAFREGAKQSRRARR
jgi:hypothetical protein